jgi:hypothetical protein
VLGQFLTKTSGFDYPNYMDVPNYMDDQMSSKVNSRKYLKIMGAVLLSFSTFSLIPKLALYLGGGSLGVMSGTTKMMLDVFCAGAASVAAVNFVHPIDFVKIRIQTQSQDNRKGMFAVSKEIWNNGGIGAFYKGIGPAWLREASEKSMRLGLYDPIKILVGATLDASPLKKFLAGAIAGAIGSLFGNPFDLLKVRMMADKDNKGAKHIISDIW